MNQVSNITNETIKTFKKMLQLITSNEVKVQDFAGFMGRNSIQNISASDLGFEEDIQGYISIQDEDGFYYAEYLDSEGTGEYAKSKNIDELQKWLTDSIYNLAKEYSEFND